MRMTTTDEALATAAAGGDRDAFATLLERCYDDLFRLTFRLTGRRSDAEDLTQDICAALPEILAGFRGQARFSTWLYRVAVNSAHDARRRAATRAKASQGWGDWELARRADNKKSAERMSWLTRTMAALPADIRDTLALLIDGEMTHAEAGEVLQVSEGTISWRMSEAKKCLRVLSQEEQSS